MALSFDFSCLVKRLDKTIKELEDEDNDFYSEPLVRDSTTTLRECLTEMSSRNLRTCLVHYRTGVKPKLQRKASGKKEIAATAADESRGSKVLARTATLSVELLPLPKHLDKSLNEWAHQTYQYLDMRDVLFVLLERYDEGI